MRKQNKWICFRSNALYVMLLCTRQKINSSKNVVHVKAGIHDGYDIVPTEKWIPAFAGKTNYFLSCTALSGALAPNN